MRLLEKDLKTVWIKEPMKTTGPSGKPIEGWSENPVEVKMNIQPAKGVVMAQIYGNKLNTVKACKYQGDAINEGEQELWGVCLFVNPDENPDFKITSIETYSTHKNIVIERL